MRKAIQILSAEKSQCAESGTVEYTSVIALCDDGSIWQMGFDVEKYNSKWYPLPAIPQDSDECGES
jgi:hypothetical protein